MFGKARLKLTLWYAGALALILLLLGSAAWVAVRRSLNEDIDDSLREAQALLLGQPDALPRAEPDPEPGDEDEDGNGDEEDEDHDTPPPQALALPSDVFDVVTDEEGVVFENPRSVNLEGVDFHEAAEHAGPEGDWSEQGAGPYRLLSLRADGFAGVPAARVHFGRSLEARDRQLNDLLTILLAGGAGGLALALAGGWLVAGLTLTPLRRSFESQRRFVSDASHELRTPVAVVQANNELLQRHPEQTIAENEEQVEAIAAEAVHMGRLVDDLLTLARADEGRLELAREPFDLRDLLAEVVRDLEPVARKRGVDLRQDLTAVHGLGDARRVRQLALIFLNNALQHTPPGGSVTVSCGLLDGSAGFSVADTGPGIAREHQGRIFDRFYRVQGGRSRSEGGTGLGLAIARTIAAAHGGRVWVTSEPGAGATFHARLPEARHDLR
jgi:signal transduction histidine kinase